jgi:hypothetical protein
LGAHRKLQRRQYALKNIQLFWHTANLNDAAKRSRRLPFARG